VAENENPQKLIAFLKSLRAVRQFRPDPVPQEVIDAILDVARWSGSASNRQPWELVVIRNRETLRTLASFEGFAHHLAGAPLGIVLVMAGQSDQIEQETFDEGRLSERMMLAALAYGVGSSIGWLLGTGVAHAKKLLGIPAERTVRTILSMGYPDEEARRARPKQAQARKPMTGIVYEEHYGTPYRGAHGS
jgi:nitroreductase